MYDMLKTTLKEWLGKFVFQTSRTAKQRGI